MGERRISANEHGIEKMLVLSTENLPPKVCNEWMEDECPWARFKKGDYGWFMYVPADMPLAGVEPVAIIDCIRYAKSRGCSWIMFDRDASTTTTLPTYEW